MTHALIEHRQAARFLHDCGKCTYLGNLNYPDPVSNEWLRADLYVCERTALARYGDEPSEYASTLLDIALQRTPPFSTHGFAVHVAALWADWRNREMHDERK